MSRYLVTLQIGDQPSSHPQTILWDASNHAPKRIGQSLPWSLITRQGRVVLRHKSGRKFEIKPEQLEGQSAISLPVIEGDRSTPARSQVRIKRVKAFPSLLESPSTRAIVPGAGSLTMVAMGLRDAGWVIESGSVEETWNGTYRAFADKRELFQIRKKDGGRLELKPKASGVTLNGQPLDAANLRTIESTEISDSTLSWGRYVWRLTSLSSARLTVPDAPVRDLEAEWFKRISIGVVVGLGLLFLIGTFLADQRPPVEESKENKTFAKIVIKPRPKAAAQQAAAPSAKVEAPSAKPKPKQPQVSAPTPAKAPPQPPKVVTAPPQPTPPKPQPPKVNQAVLAAQKLQQSMSALMPGGMTSLLKETTIAKGTNNARQSQFLNGKSDAINSAAPTQGLAAQNDVNVTVGEGGGSGNYRWAAPGATGDGSGSGKFLSIGTGEDTGSASLVEDGLSKREVWEVINKHFSEIRNCYESAITRKADIEGKLIVQFSINATGNVQSATAKGSTLKDPRLDQCIVDRLKKWQFPKPKGKSEVSVTYPFLFKRL